MKKLMTIFSCFLISIGISPVFSQNPTVTEFFLPEAPKQIQVQSGSNKEVRFMNNGNVFVNGQSIGNPLGSQTLTRGFATQNEVLVASESEIYYSDILGSSWTNVLVADSGDYIMDIREHQGKLVVVSKNAKVYARVKSTSIVPDLSSFMYIGTDSIGDYYPVGGVGVDDLTGDLIILHTLTNFYTRNQLNGSALISSLESSTFDNLDIFKVKGSVYSALVGFGGNQYTMVMSLSGGVHSLFGANDYLEVDVLDDGTLLCSGSQSFLVAWEDPFGARYYPSEIFIFDPTKPFGATSFTNIFTIGGARPNSVAVLGDTIAFAFNSSWVEATQWSFSTGGNFTGIVYVDMSPETSTGTANATEPVNELELAFHSLGEGGTFRVRSDNLRGINLEIRDINGKSVAQVTENQKSEVQIEIQNLPAGIYTAIASGETTTVTKKFFVH